MRMEEGCSTLDIGCGTGEEVWTMAEIVGKAGRAVGVDSSEVMLDEARKRAQSQSLPMEFFKADGYGMPFRDNTFDAVRAERLFEHLEQPHMALAGMLRNEEDGSCRGHFS